MTDGVTIKVTNKDRLFARFRRLAPAADRELIEAALLGANEVAGLARRFSQNDRVRQSIKVEAVPGRPAVVVAAGDASTQVEVRKGSGKMWGLERAEEFGVKKHRLGGIFAGAMHPGSAPRPFLFPAFRLLKKRVQARLGRALGKAARAVAK